MPESDLNATFARALICRKVSASIGGPSNKTIDGCTRAAMHIAMKSVRLTSRVPFVQLRRVDSASPIFSATVARVSPFSLARILKRSPHLFHDSLSIRS